jgi:hemerythrin
MALMKWDQQFSVENDAIDTQHKQLVNLVNQLHDAMSSGTGSKIVGTVLDELMAYTRQHFSSEEQVMSRAKYPELTAHAAEHAKLTCQVAKLQEGLKSGQVLTMDVMTFLVSWLGNHIMKVDKRYVPFVRAA